MAIEGHKCGRGADHKKKSKEEIDKKLIEIRARMEQTDIEDATGDKGTLEVRMASEQEGENGLFKSCWPESSNKS
jgi:hypothetical protein